MHQNTAQEGKVDYSKYDLDELKTKFNDLVLGRGLKSAISLAYWLDKLIENLQTPEPVDIRNESFFTLITICDPELLERVTDLEYWELTKLSQYVTQRIAEISKTRVNITDNEINDPDKNTQEQAQNTFAERLPTQIRSDQVNTQVAMAAFTPEQVIAHNDDQEQNYEEKLSRVPPFINKYTLSIFALLQFEQETSYREVETYMQSEKFKEEISRYFPELTNKNSLSLADTLIYIIDKGERAEDESQFSACVTMGRQKYKLQMNFKKTDTSGQDFITFKLSKI